MPRNILKGKKVSPETLGAVASVHVDKDANSGTAPDSGLNVIESTVLPQEEGQNKTVKQTVFFDSASGEAWPTITDKGLDEKGFPTDSTITRIDPSSSLPTVTVNTVDIEQKSETKDRAVLTVITHTPSDLVSRSYDYEKAFGEKADVTESIITPGSGSDALPDLDATTLDAEIIHDKAQRKIKRVRTINGSQPTLNTWEYDQRTGVMILSQKKIVAASTVPTDSTTFTAKRTALSLATEDVLEYQPIDKWRSIQIVSKLGTVWTEDQVIGTYPGTINHSFPDYLTSAALRWMWIATASDFSFDVALHLEITEGYNGPCKATITEYVTKNPSGFYARNPGIELTAIDPQAYTLEVGYAAYFGSKAMTMLRTVSIPATVHSAVPIDYEDAFNPGTPLNPDGTTPTGHFTTLPATNPVSPPLTIVKEISAEKWRFGYYLIKVASITRPT